MSDASKQRAKDALLGPPPIQIVLRRLFTHRILSYAEAEAYHLRRAAKLTQSASSSGRARSKQTEHLRQAELNRHWAWRDQRGILEDFK